MPGEFELIREYFACHGGTAHVPLGIGDDCAIMSPPAGSDVAVTTDTQNEGVHFFKGTEPSLLGWKSLLVNVSDLAAMGAEPWCFTLSLTLPESKESFLRPFSEGLFELAARCRMGLVGGNTSKGPLSITIEAFGLLPKGKALRRDGGRPGDLLYVTGTLGLPGLYVDAGYGKVKAGQEQIKALCRKSMRIAPRHEFAKELLRLGLSSCAIDVSDGVVGDLEHIIERSGVGAELDLGALPLAPELSEFMPSPQARLEEAAYGGGDYELLFTSAPGKAGAVRALSSRAGVPVTCIGRLCGRSLKIMKDDKIVTPARKPFEHF
ncbi:MAG: thiamine-phosphate kinase [Succinivibrio sp.]